MIDLSISGELPASIHKKDIMNVITRVFTAQRIIPAGSVSVVFVTDPAMRKMNKRWRRKDRATDVLSFAPPTVPTTRSTPRQWGDIFVSPAFVRAEAQRRGIAFREELLRVIVHGMLHLFGYDHATEREETKMFGIQERILTSALKTL